MKINIASSNQLDQIYSLTQDCVEDMLSKGVFQWNESYPSKDILAEDIDRGELFCLQAEEEIIGIVVVSDIEDPEYQGVDWLTPQGNSAYVHRLAVHPKHQYKGYAKQLMDFAEGYAESMGYLSVRLDTFSKNERNNKFYRNRGYKQLGDIYIEDQSEHPFHCYELVF